MKRPYRNFMISTSAMIALTLARAHAGQLASVKGFYGINHESGGQNLALDQVSASGTQRTVGVEVKGRF